MPRPGMLTEILRRGAERKQGSIGCRRQNLDPRNRRLTDEPKAGQVVGESGEWLQVMVSLANCE